MAYSKKRKELGNTNLKRSRKYNMIGGDVTQKMVRNILRILEIQFPASYASASRDYSWYNWKAYDGWR
jgi:hypothetical protein